MSNEKAKKAPIKFTGFALTMNYATPNLTQLIMLEIKDGVVISNETMSDPDAPKITTAKAEGMFWKIYDHIRLGH